LAFEMAPKYRVAWIALAVCFGLDRLSKSLVVGSLSYTDRVPVLEGFFYLTHVRNAGAAFGLLADADASWRLAFFIGVTILAVGVILVFLRDLDANDRLSGLALGLIMGGATGNLYDRFRYGEVVDFLHFRLWSGYSCLISTWQTVVSWWESAFCSWNCWLRRGNGALPPSRTGDRPEATCARAKRGDRKVDAFVCIFAAESNLSLTRRGEAE